MSRRPKEKLDTQEWGPYPHCLEWNTKSSLDRHMKSCPVGAGHGQTTKDSLQTRFDVSCGRILDVADQAMMNEVFPIMRCDIIGNVARKDVFIVMLGNQWMQRNVGNKINRKYYTSCIMG